MARGRKMIAYNPLHCRVCGSGSSAVACLSFMIDPRKQAPQTSCNTSCTAVKPYEDKISFTPCTDSPHVSGRPDVVPFLGTSIQLRFPQTTMMFQIEMLRANRHEGTWAFAYEQDASHIQANRGYDPTVPSIHRPLFQLRHHHGYTNYVCTITLLVTTAAILEVHPIPTYETPPWRDLSQGRKRKMQQEHAVILTARSAVVLTLHPGREVLAVDLQNMQASTNNCRAVRMPPSHSHLLLQIT